MALSLQEQLLKAGVADKSSARQARADKRKKKKSKQATPDETKLAAQQAIDAKKAKDRALNEQQQAVKEQRSIDAQVKQLIDLNRQDRKNGDIALNITHENVIKRIYVTVALQKGVLAGKLAVVKDERSDYELVPIKVADKIKQRRPEVVVYVASSEDAALVSDDDQDDWYSDFEIPDDLTW